MQFNTNLSVIALTLVALPLAAQTRSGRDRIPTRTPTDARVILGIPTDSRTDTRTSSKIPRGQLPPKGMCRVWIDGVPPGQQPPVTDCATAERNRVANSRVIYGDRESFPGNGKGKFKNSKNRNTSTSCVSRDAVVIGGRVVDVCRDANGDIIRDDRTARRGRDDDEDDDDDRLEQSGRRFEKEHSNKGKHGKHGKN